MADNNFPLYALAFLLTFILTTLICKVLIPLLTQKAEQPIYEDGPSWHASKSGTPTMGGLSFLISISLVMLLSSVFLFLERDTYSAISLLTCLCYGVMNSIVGIIDDSTKLKRRQNKGLSPTQKLVLQFLLSALFLAARYWLLKDANDTSLIIGGLDISYLYYPVATLILVGITNCANLTDGIDGLASGVAFAGAVSVFYISYAAYSEVSFISSSLIGATIGFLIFNINPAKIFMGDTGSLFLGALLASLAIAMNKPPLILLVGGVYVIEGASVIIQVLFYKLTKKRVFKMAPFHHHLEKCGWSENKICMSAIIVTFILSVVAYVIYLP